MRNIAIIGSGQSGLILGLGLLQSRYDVTLYTERDQNTLRHGRVLSSQCLFSSSLEIEQAISGRKYDDTHNVNGISLKVINPHNGQSDIQWTGKLKASGQAIDQRMKLADLMDGFLENGGRIINKSATLADLDVITEKHDLVIVATGNSPLSKEFKTMEMYSPFSKSQRRLALCYVHGMQGRPESEEVSCRIIPGLGEYFVIPAITFSGPCHIAFIEAIPGGGLDCFDGMDSPDETLRNIKNILKKYIPEEYENIKNAELTDENASLTGAVRPVVRHPVMTLPSGKHVLAMGDAAVINDPITGQGANSAIKAAKMYLDAIIEHGENPFDDKWMSSVFYEYWEYVKFVCVWTNSLLIPPSDNILAILAEAQDCPSTADRVAEGFNNPSSLFPWWLMKNTAFNFQA